MFPSTQRQGSIMRAKKTGKNKDIFVMAENKGKDIQDIQVHHKDRQTGM